MRIKAFHKDILRAVTHSWSRFLALFIIVALGAGFYSGLRTTAPNMRATADAYFDESRFMDVRLVSTFGFTEDDVDAIRATEGVRSVMAGYSADLLVRMGEKDVVARIHSLPSDLSADNEDYLNRPTVIEGRMPEKSGECVVSAPPVGDMTGLQIGDTVTVEDPNGDIADTLARSTFTVVGFVESSYYLSMSLGTSTIGSGTLSRYLYIFEEDFSQEYYTDLHLTVDGAMELASFSDTYDAQIEPVTDRLEALADEREPIRYDEIYQEAVDTLDDAQQTYDEEKEKADKELADAYQELVDGQKELDDAYQELLDGEQELADGKKELEDARQELADGRQEVADARVEYEDGLAEYEDGVRQLEDGKKEYEDGVQELADAKREWQTGNSDYLMGLNQYQHNYDVYLDQKEEAEAQFADARKQLSDAQKELNEGKKELEANRSSYNQAKTFLSGVEQIIAMKEQSGGETGGQQITTQQEAMQFLTKLMAMETQEEQIAAVTALDDASKGVLREYINGLLQNDQLPEEDKTQLRMLLTLLGSSGGEPDEPQISTDEQAAAFLQQLQENSAQMQTMIAALDDSSLQYLSNYLQTVIDSSTSETQIAQLTMLKTLVDAQLDAGSDPGGSEPDEGLTEDEIPAFLRQLAGMSEQEAAAALMALDLDELRLLQSYLQSSINQFEAGERELASGSRELTKARREYEEQKAEVDAQFAEAEQEFADAKAELDDAKRQLDDGWQEILDGEQELLDAKAEIEENEQKLADAAVELEDGRRQLLDAEQELADGEQELLDGEQELLDAEQELEDGWKEYEDGKQELEDGWQEYEDGKQEAEQELADAQQEIDDGRKELDDLKMPEWYVLDRGTNVGCASFEGDCDRMESLSTVFPTMFFLVAALVALTTMTRMVDEERGVIGAYKALGYGRMRIASKYLFYAAVPSVLGSLFGTFLGNQALPRICWSAYLMMYSAPDMTIVFQPGYVAIGCLASAVCTLGSTAIACRSELRETPAALLQPKAPKAGKRIFLEHVGILWKRLKFTQKVTCRNLFLYKRRLFMTIVGISGATGLLLTGFGIKDSISGIVEKQYSEIYRYDTIVSLKDNEISDGVREILDDGSFDEWMTVMKKTADLSVGDKSYSGYVLVPEDAEELSKFINLRDRTSGEAVPFAEGSVLATEKLANLLGVGVGGTISVENEDGELVGFTVTGIVENYVYHYLYISPELYEEKMGEPFEATELDAVCTETDEAAREAAAASLQEQEGVSTAGFTEDTRASFDDLIESLNSIIAVIIFCAGALTFVVLYNLTNINVTERQRELATIKVLGFYDGEVAGYIYRETSLLTILGCAIGLVLGIFMQSFVIQTVEVDMVMFGRTIEPLSFVYSALLTLLFAVVVDFVMFPRLKKIDMVESLKSVD